MPDTNLGENTRHAAMFDEQAARYIFPRVQAYRSVVGFTTASRRHGITPQSPAMTPEQQRIQEQRSAGRTPQAKEGHFKKAIALPMLEEIKRTKKSSRSATANQ